jgi:surface protein
MSYKGIIKTMPKLRPFIIEVKTDNFGSSGTSQFTIPITATATGYSYTVKTSNGVITTTASSITLTWPTPGTYEVEVYGDRWGVYFNDSGDKLKILNIKQWGSLRWTDMTFAFHGCSNLDVIATDSPNLSLCSSMFWMFARCANLINTNGSIGNWNVSTIIDMTSLFFRASNFNQPLNSWNTSNVTSMSSMFNNAIKFNQNIGSWNVSKVQSFGTMFYSSLASPHDFNNGNSSDINNWIINTNPAQSVEMGSMFRASKFNQPLNGWDTSRVTTMSAMFTSATLFNQDIGDWTVSQVNDFSLMFNNATVFNNGNSNSIKDWVIKTSGTVDMTNMFSGTQFNQPINTNGLSWNTSNVTKMAGMFSLTPFNQAIGSWNTSSVTNMGGMFNSATQFNQDIGDWDVSNVTNFNSMFYNATQFNNGGNDTIKNWVINSTSSINMGFMFFNAITFNQPINTSGLSWNTSNVTDMSRMFSTARAFNQDISGWNTINVATMFMMFEGAWAFNQNISTWLTTNVTNMSRMFSTALAFNQNISTWDTSNVTNMSLMFQNTPVFNQNISIWNVSKVTDFSQMFAAAQAFNRNLGAWQLRLAGTNLNSSFSLSGMSTANYTDTIVGWANYVQTNSGTPSNVAMGTQSSRIFQNSRSGGASFATAGAARTYLTSATPGGAGWSISDTIIA